MTRNNVEVLEPRVLLSAHGANASHDSHAEHFAQTSIQSTYEQKGDQDQSAGQTENSDPQFNPSTKTGIPTDTQTAHQNDVTAPQSEPSTEHTIPPDWNPILPFPPVSSGGDQSAVVSGPRLVTGPQQVSEPTEGNSDANVTWSGWFPVPWQGMTDGSSASDTTPISINAGTSGGVTVIDIIYIDPPTLPIGSATNGPIVKHPLNNGSDDAGTDAESSSSNSGTSTGGNQQHSTGNGNSGSNNSDSSSGSNNSSSSSGNESTPPAQGDESDGSHVARPAIQHGNGTPPPIYDPGSAGGSVTPDVSHQAPTPALSPAVPVARPVSPTDQSAAVTPLAMTPSHGSSSSVFANTPVAAGLNIVSVASAHDSGPTGKAATSDGPTVHMSGPIAASVPSILTLTKAIDAAVPAAAKAVVRQIQTAGEVVTGAEVVTAQAIEQALPAKATYNFMRFDAASFQDAVAAFANELATIARPASSHHSTTRAWIITGTVIGVDAILLGYWRIKSRKQQKARLALAKAAANPST